MITLDLNHFGFCGRGGQRGGEDGEKKEAKVRLKEGIRRANLNGGELDRGNTSGTHKGNHKGGVLSQGQPKWWRAGRRTFSPG